jgi:Lipoxygenase
MLPPSRSNSVGEYEWELSPSYVPPHIKTLPKDQGFSTVKMLKFDGLVAKGVLSFLFSEVIYFFRRLATSKIHLQMTADFGLAEAFKVLNEWHRVEDFNYLYKPWTTFDRPRVADTWDRDEEFASARLYGVNPAFIRRCRPEDLRSDGNFSVSEALINQLLPTTSLADELTSGHLYLLDYKILSNILTKELQDQLGRYPVAPLCLFHINEQQQLMPIAIRLWQDGDLETNPILTRLSPSQSWLTAKVAVSGADIAYQGIVSHLLNTHLIVETFGMCTYRQLSCNHIVFQLLQPHLFNTFAINEMARGIFLGHDGFFDVTGALGFTGSNELLKRAYSGEGNNYQGDPLLFYKMALPIDLIDRDVMDLPGYYYRDDGMQIWNAIHSYVNDILMLRYPSSEDLLMDEEMQAWKQELVSPDFGRIKGLLSPEKEDQISGPLREIKDLADVLATIIFTATAQHSAVNFGQYEYAGWVPNMPFALYQPLTDVSNQQQPKIELIARFPNRVQTIKQMILVKALSLPVPHSSKSLLTMKNPFKDTEAQRVFEQFQRVHLQHIEQQINARNASIQQPYIRLLPSNIAQSVAI